MYVCIYDNNSYIIMRTHIHACIYNHHSYVINYIFIIHNLRFFNEYGQLVLIKNL